MTHSEKTVFSSGNLEIVRVRYWGFRCNSLSTIWQIRRDGKWVGQSLRLRDAKKQVLEGRYQ